VLRVQTPEEVRDFTDEFDKLLREVLNALVMRGGSAKLSKQQWQQATLPLNLGGLGVTTTKGTAPQAWLAAVAQAWPSMVKDPAFVGRTHTNHKGHYAALARKAASSAQQDTGEMVTLSSAVKDGPHGLQRRLSQASAKQRLTRLKTYYSGQPRKAAHLHRLASAATTSVSMPAIHGPSFPRPFYPSGGICRHVAAAPGCAQD